MQGLMLFISVLYVEQEEGEDNEGSIERNESRG